jgi:ribose 5-phosphate isomerase B
MNIAIGSDHAGYETKQRLAVLLGQKGHAVHDLGTHSPDACDYPPIALAVAEAVAGRKADGGILICGTGVGMSIAANKVPGVRASLCITEMMAHDTRSHNASNVLVLAARVNPVETNLKLAEIWMNAGPSSVERHQRRVKQIAEIEKKFMKTPGAT